MDFGTIFQNVFGRAPNNNQPASPQQQAQQQQPITNNPAQNPPPAGTAQTQQTDANGVIPKEAQASPLDKYKDIWKTPEPDPNAQRPTEIAIDPKKLTEAASKVDFTRILDPESLSKIQGGGQEAVTALAALLNKTAQATYGQSMIAANQMVAEAVKTAKTEFQEAIPQLVKKQSAAEKLFENHPAFQNPAVQPILKAVQTQITERHPTASAAEVNKMALEMVAGMAEIFGSAAPKPKETSNNPNGLPKQQDDQDWSLYLNS